MADRLRAYAGIAAAAALGALLLWGAGGLPNAGSCASAMAERIVSRAVPERRATEIVSAVNFDYRGFDTLGEEFILFGSVAGVLVLLRPNREERPEPDAEGADQGRDRPRSPLNEAVRQLAVVMAGATVIVGLSISAHGQLTPGGGFQGGVALATAPLLVYLAGDYRLFRRVTPAALLEAGEGIGTGGFAALGLAGLATSGSFLMNLLPLGRPGELCSGGTILALGLLTGLAVASGFLLLLSSFLGKTVERRPKDA